MFRRLVFVAVIHIVVGNEPNVKIKVSQRYGGKI
jgi:hypothetical protein